MCVSGIAVIDVLMIECVCQTISRLVCALTRWISPLGASGGVGRVIVRIIGDSYCVSDQVKSAHVLVELTEYLSVKGCFVLSDITFRCVLR